jgi:hypothetical protein
MRELTPRTDTATGKPRALDRLGNQTTALGFGFSERGRRSGDSASREAAGEGRGEPAHGDRRQKGRE